MVGRRTFVALGIAALLTTSLPASAEPTDKPDIAQHKRDAVSLLTIAFNEKKVSAAFERYVDAGYIQHNPFVPTGRAAAVSGLSTYLQANPDLTYEIKRVIAEGDLVVVHSRVSNGSADRGRAVVDIFRFNKAGLIIEHWDVVQPVPEPSANSNTMF